MQVPASYLILATAGRSPSSETFPVINQKLLDHLGDAMDRALLRKAALERVVVMSRDGW